MAGRKEGRLAGPLPELLAVSWGSSSKEMDGKAKNASVRAFFFLFFSEDSTQAFPRGCDNITF